LNLIKNAVDIVLAQASQKGVGNVDVLIAPDLKAFSSTDLKDAPGLVEAGYRAAMEVMDQLENWGPSAPPNPPSLTDTVSVPKGT